MGKKVSASGGPYFRPRYYLKRPTRLAFLFLPLISLLCFLYDRQLLTRDHEEEILRLNEEITILRKRKATDEEPYDPVSIQRREKPQTKDGVDSFGGLGATIVDSLDTLYIMGLEDQFQRAREWIVNSLDFNKNLEVSVFETTIRVLGGLLGTYDLSGDKIFLEKARELADKLLPAWDSPTGIPFNRINLAHGNAHNPSWTGAEKVIRVIQKSFPDDGLLSVQIDPQTGATSYGSITFGAMGDSFYEYLLEVWIQGNKTEEVKFYREMWEKSMKGLQSLTKKSTPSSFVYLAEKIGTSLTDKMDELACFAPGMLALGSSGYNPGEGEKILSLAKELAWTCYNFYQSTPTKLAGENYYFEEGKDMNVGTSWNILRPETVESLFYLWRLTGNKTYQEWGWNIFQAFEKNSRIESGYVGLTDVVSGTKDDMMQSFFLAETLKYLYLLFSPPSVVPLDEWVFNTEAHPIRIVTRDGHQEHMSANQKRKTPRHMQGRKEGILNYK